MNLQLIILDRDGVINVESDLFIKSPEEWVAIPGSLEAIAELNRAGFTVAVATNQSGIARGLYSEEMLHSIHQKMQDELAKVGGAIDAIFYCPHHPDDGCECRKPLPGLLNQITEHYSCSLDGVPFVGDTLRDARAAQAAGATPVLVRSGYHDERLEQIAKDENILVFDNLLEFSENVHLYRDSG